MSEVHMEGFHLSPQQRHLWSLHRDAPAAYTAWSRLRIRGPLNLGALERAIEDTYGAHEILRTFFRGLEEVSVPLQVTGESIGEPLQAVDFSDLDPAESRHQVERIESDVRVCPKLSEAPLVRIRLATLAPEEHLLWVSAPSLCADAKGLDNLIAIIIRNYEMRLVGETPADEPLQYVDASAWLNEVLDSDDTKLGREYWSQNDLTSLRDVKLPFERKAASVGFAPCRIAVELPPTLAAVSASIEATPELVLMTCWQWLLSRFVGDPSLVVSTSYPLRDYEELEKALGIFVRQLPLSGDLPGSLSLREASKRLGNIAREAESWALSFEYRRLESRGDGARLDWAPYIFESIAWPGHWRVGDTMVQLEERRAVPDRFKMKLIYEYGEDLERACLEYDVGLYREEDVAGCARALEALLRDSLSRPDTSLDRLSLSSESERSAFLRTLDANCDTTSANQCIHEAFAERARELPERPAVVSGDEGISYAALDRDSNRIARRLIDMGIRPDGRVALCLERAPESIVVMLAVLKAGGAYVPLDPKLPEARRRQMLHDCGAEILVSREALGAGWPPAAVRTLLLDRDREAIASEPNLPVASQVAPENLAYVLFTSGSTGRPKAVAIEHRQLLNYIRGITERLELDAEASFASVTTLGADLGNTSIFAALCGGGTLDLVPDDCVADPDAFSRYMSDHNVDVLKIVPSHLEMLLTSSRPAAVLPRKLLILGGEACTWELVRAVRGLSPRLSIMNHYGPTETTIGVTTYRLPDDPGEELSRTVPIGRALRNVRTYVLDERGSLLPAWMPGELYIGGGNVARGYLQAAGAKEDRFLPDPFSPDEAGRMYKTGDIVRMLPSGDLEFLGRADDQVKVRGFRVELGEVEAGLRKHPSVEEACVILHRDAGADARLLGFVVPGVDSDLDAATLRTFLGRELPEYMVPSSITFLDELPLNSNGKLDRSALATSVEKQTVGRAKEPDEFTSWELVVRDVWSELLHTDNVSTHDNFYDLGGHSLLAIRVVSEIENRTGLHVSPRELVFHTLRQFAALCQSKEENPGSTA